MALFIVKRRLIKCKAFVMTCIKLKYCLIFFIVFILFRHLHSTKPLNKFLQVVSNPTPALHLNYLVLHLDLKGTPPTLQYLQDLVPTLQPYGVNSLLMEYEDMFPYEGRLVNLSARNCYDKQELKIFLNLVHTLGIEVIPLVQTFGHMEHVLKLKEFMHLREVTRFPSEICPSKNESIELIAEMLQQVIQLHTSIVPLKHIHIGCDEVYHINVCSKCRQQKLDDTMLYINHVKAIDNVIRKLSPQTTVLIWNDMLTHRQNALRSMDLNLSNIEPVYWDYRGNFKVSHKELFEYHKVFNNIWVASAFKGADSIQGILPDLTARFRNNRQWLKIITNYHFAGENKAYQFKGIILTGWSRYSHMSPPCELLTSSIPSLVLNLLLIKAVMKGVFFGDLYYMKDCELYDKHLRANFEDKFGHSSIHGTTECAFEGNQFHKQISKYFNVNCCKSSLREFEFLEYNFRMQNINLLELQKGIKTFNNVIDELLQQSEDLKEYMMPYYDNDTIHEYVSYKIGNHIASLRNTLSILQNYTKVTFWERRPYHKSLAEQTNITKTGH